MAEAKDRLDLAALSYRFSQLETLCTQLEDLTKQPKYAQAVCQRILVNLRDELKLVDIALEGRMRSIIAQFGITSRELYILIFGDKDRLLKKAFRNDQESIIELVSTIRTSISLWKTRVTGGYEKLSTTSIGGTTDTIAEAQQGAPPSDWKAPFGKNVLFRHNLLGEVEIRYISFGDTYRITKFLDETNLRRFATLIVHNQLAPVSYTHLTLPTILLV